jgi:hypothetical protein
MCHAFLEDSRFYQFLFQIDQEIANEVQLEGCAYCGGRLHFAGYPRKPRGMRCARDGTYETRLSFCCANEGCRRRCTPPSVRFLGRKVYLGSIVILVMAMEHGLSIKRRKRLIDQLDLYPQTLSRWRQWWRQIFPVSRCWQTHKSHFIPSVDIRQLPGALLGRLHGNNLAHRVCLLLRLLMPITTSSWSGSLTVVIDPQKM